ncbi:lipopolysaccharide biosynthesis protein [Flavobacterium sp. 3HN19-14]|uniref:lipopolysaccharide biosynthesis protein n=1 Tax=Flavobacterium sp. 3HN19-14 TaxID=3448133 RepID=UPI003EDFA23B
MGIVIKQSAKNTVVTYFGFGIGAINALFLYTTFLGKEYYGIVGFLLSAANILMPFMAFGAHNTMIRFFSRCKSEEEREKFMSFMLLMPIILIVPLTLLIYFFYDSIVAEVVAQNPSVGSFLWLIPVVGICMAYFEIFYAWVKVHMKSVFGNFISEVLVRVIVMLLLIALHFDYIGKDDFIYCLSGAYALQFLAMNVYAVYVKMPKLSFAIPHNIKELAGYSLFIILSGSIANLLIDFDKVVIPAYKAITENAVYSVAIFMATVIAVPSRAMLQIIYPITAKLMSEGKMEELSELYKKSAITLQVIGGLIMLGIFLNIDEMYKIIPGNYASGTMVVFIIGLSRFYDVIVGNNNAIILNTKYYKTVMFFGVMTVIVMLGLLKLLIPPYGIIGAAWATLITMVIYNTVKLLFVMKKLNMSPFSVNTLKSFAIITAVFLGFYFWEFPFHPIINITLKSFLISLIYIGINYKLVISSDINNLIDKTFSMLKHFKKA